MVYLFLLCAMYSSPPLHPKTPESKFVHPVVLDNGLIESWTIETLWFEKSRTFYIYT
jgi:hypothetical protein